MKNRKGIFKIGNVFLDNPCYETLNCVFSSVFPIDIIKNKEKDNTTYVAYSLLFRELKEGHKIPEYELRINKKHNMTGVILEVKEISMIRIK